MELMNVALCNPMTYLFNATRQIVVHVDFMIDDELVVLQAELGIGSPLPQKFGELMELLSLKKSNGRFLLVVL